MIDYYADQRHFLARLYLSFAIAAVATVALFVCAVMVYRSRIAAAMERRRH